jgi:hypothetical protein
METAFPYLGNADFFWIFQTILKDFQKALATHILQYSSGRAASCHHGLGDLMLEVLMLLMLHHQAFQVYLPAKLSNTYIYIYI